MADRMWGRKIRARGGPEAFGLSRRMSEVLFILTERATGGQVCHLEFNSLGA